MKAAHRNGELLQWVSGAECRMDAFEIDVKGISDGKKFLRMLLVDHFGSVIRCEDFCSMTGINENQYYRLIGNDRKGGFSKPTTLLRVAYGLGLTYQEAVLLFWFNDIAVDNRIHGKLNEILYKLNELDKCDEYSRMHALEENCKKFGFSLTKKN